MAIASIDRSHNIDLVYANHIHTCVANRKRIDIAISIHIIHSLAHSAHADVPTHKSALHRFSGCSCRKDSYKTYNTVKIYLIFKLMTRTTSCTISNGYCALGIHAYLSACMYNVHICLPFQSTAL